MVEVFREEWGASDDIIGIGKALDCSKGVDGLIEFRIGRDMFIVCGDGWLAYDGGDGDCEFLVLRGIGFFHFGDVAIFDELVHIGEGLIECLVGVWGDWIFCLFCIFEEDFLEFLV